MDAEEKGLTGPPGCCHGCRLSGAFPALRGAVLWGDSAGGQVCTPAGSQKKTLEELPWKRTWMTVQSRLAFCVAGAGAVRAHHPAPTRGDRAPPDPAEQPEQLPV